MGIRKRALGIGPERWVPVTVKLMTWRRLEMEGERIPERLGEERLRAATWDLESHVTPAHVQ